MSTDRQTFLQLLSAGAFTRQRESAALRPGRARQAFVEAGHAQVQLVAGLLATDVRRLARVGRLARPLLEIRGERTVHALDMPVDKYKGLREELGMRAERVIKKQGTVGAVSWVFN